MPTQAEIDAEYENAELKRRLERVEAWMNAVDEAGLDRLRESGLLQFDGIPMRWDSNGMQLEANATSTTALYILQRLVATPSTKYPRGILYGNIDGENGNNEATTELASQTYASGDPSVGRIILSSQNGTTGTVTLSADPTSGTSGVVTVSANATATYFTWNGQTLITGVLTPAQIIANQDDYNPTGLATTTTLRLLTDASRDITGIAGGDNGRVLLVFNVGSFPIVLKDESASSTAANRFALGGSDLTLNSGESTPLWYDSTSSRWRPF